MSFKTLGFSTVMDFITAMPGVVAWERPSSGDWLLYDASGPRPSSPSLPGMNVSFKSLGIYLFSVSVGSWKGNWHVTSPALAVSKYSALANLSYHDAK